RVAGRGGGDDDGCIGGDLYSARSGIDGSRGNRPGRKQAIKIDQHSRCNSRILGSPARRRNGLLLAQGNRGQDAHLYVCANAYRCRRGDGFYHRGEGDSDGGDKKYVRAVQKKKHAQEKKAMQQEKTGRWRGRRRGVLFSSGGYRLLIRRTVFP